jgi:hypothetical protein|tara:strand:+ start:50161 stop:50379 length:219 start_codon:yes stop_codon:yes gene_type:complete
MSKPTHEELQAQMAEFLAKGKSIETVDSGTRTLSERELYFKASGRIDQKDDYTERQMRSAENQETVRHPFYR